MPENKVVYLSKIDGRSIKCYVLDYLLDTETKNTYLLIVDQHGKNAKAFEITNDKAIILSADEVGMFSRYNLNPRFTRITSGYEDGKNFLLVKRGQILEETNLQSKKQEEKSETKLPEEVESKKEQEEITPQAESVPEKPSEQDEDEVLEQQAEENKEETKETIIFYVYNGDDVKKYHGTLKSKDGNTLEVTNVQYVLRISGAKNLNVDEFMENQAVEMGAYFVNFDDYEGSVERIPGKNPIANARISNVLCKNKTMDSIPVEKQEEPVLEVKPLEADAKDFEDEKVEPDTVTPIEENFEPANLQEEPDSKNDIGEEIIFYVYNFADINKYKGIVKGKSQDKLEVTNVEHIERIQGDEVLDVQSLMRKDSFETGAYFVHFIDYESNVKKENGKSIAVATLNHVSRKGQVKETEEPATIPEIQQLEEEKKEEAQKEEVKEEPIDTSDKEITFYVGDYDVIKKYKGTLKVAHGDQLGVVDVKFLESISKPNFKAEQFLEDSTFEADSYFVNFADYETKVKKGNGKPSVVAKLSYPIYKKAIKENNEIVTEEVTKAPQAEEKQTKEKKEQIVAFEGEIDTYDGKTHYTVYGTVCNVIDENPLTVEPEENGEKTIIYSDEEASSIEEVCQNYQNLYPTRSVYLLNGYEITNGEVQIISEEQYHKFVPQNNLETESLLDNGKRVLTEKEISDARAKELENLKKKRKKQKRKHQSPRNT